MPQSRKVRIGSKLTMVWGRKILEKTFQDENIVGLVEATLVAEAILQVQRERVKEYSEPIWRKHWHENKEKFLVQLEKEPRRDRKWLLDKLTDECLENNWEEHQDTASLLLIDKEYYAKIDQAHIDRGNLPLAEGNCPALEADMEVRKLKDELFLESLKLLSKIPALKALADSKSPVWWSPCKEPKPENYKGVLWTNRDFLIHSIISNICKSNKMSKNSDEILNKYI